MDYGKCSCGYSLSPSYAYVEDSNNPGYAKKMCSYLLCDACGETYIVDDSFDLPTYTKWTDIKKNN